MSDVDMENCSFYSPDNICHQCHHTRKKCLRSAWKSDEVELLHLRTGLKIRDIKSICAHHEQQLLTKFSRLQKKCCDPFDCHPGKKRTKSLRIVTMDAYKGLVNPPKKLIPGEKLCCDCLFQLQKSKVQDSAEGSSRIDYGTEDNDVNLPVESPIVFSPEKEFDLNSTLSSLGETPVRLHSLPSSSKRVKGQKKLSSASETLKRKLEEVYDVPLDSVEGDLDSSEKSDPSFKNVLEELKEKFNRSESYQERVQILTLSPFTIEKTMREFGTTNYLVKKSRAVKKEKGILGLCDKKQGKVLSKELEEEVVNFYTSDDNSRMCPGMKDTISMRDKNGEKVKHQKRLVLSNLNELYSLWKEANPEKKIGFSKFASLRPKYCVLAGATGTHAVCVCKHHQNPTLMAEACLESSVHDLIKMCVCSDESEKCMMGHCKDCPGQEGLMGYLNECDELSEIEEVSYLQWVSTDRTKLVTITESKADFIENFASQVFKLTRHSFTAKMQSLYMKELKTAMTPLTEIILQGDFAENFSYVVQDEIQSFHWENKQATLHPFVAYCRMADGTLEHRNVCVVSDCREHSTVTVHAFLRVVIPYLQTQFFAMNKIHYFTDGCAGQYKNRNNFLNLCYHQEDFKLEGEWNFFATSHGKSACDGIGGTVKRLLTKASLQRPYSNPILTSDAIMEFCTQSIPGIKFFNVTPEQIAKHDSELTDRFLLAKTVKGTQQFHRLVPMTKSKMHAYKLSLQSDPPELVTVMDSPVDVTETTEENFIEIKQQNYVCCQYDNEAWIGLVEDVSEEHGDFHIRFMHPHGPSKLFHWPNKEDNCWVSESDIFCVIDAPSLASSGRMYNLSKRDHVRIAERWKKWLTDD